MSINESLQYRELTEKIIGLFYDVYNELGFGFLESVYEEAMAIALTEAGLKIQRQYPVPVWFRNRKLGDFKSDLLVEEKILLEVEAARAFDLAYEKQPLSNLLGTRLEVVLLLTLGP